ncbi:MAG TPA: DNA replication and repair protein RecF [Blastocatellia bacterium]|jgi:DNA replication and repair protein RecF|nr:DNA replication and repair protein RecF [Blastocatellia bacterium]
MKLSRVEASGFRNLEGFVGFGPGLNIFYGNNAQGKTNWLEAIYVLGTTKSFRTSQVRDCIRFGAGESLLRGETLRGSLTKQIQLLLTESTKELYVNGKRETVVRYLGNLDVFVFSLEEMDVIRGEPSQRRRFIDRGVVTISPGFLNTISRYNHIIRQKNRLLAQASRSESPARYVEQVQAWNEQLIDFGTAVHMARVDYVERLNRVLDENDHGRAIFGAERVNVRYRSQLEGKGDLDRYDSLYRDRLALRLNAEIASGHSLIGPHRDDLEILADGREVARYGSAGQQRSALLLLDLAQVSIYNSIYEESPVLLIDDIDAELDKGRIEALLVELEGRAQTFVSTSRRAIASRYSDRASVYYVDGGRAVPDPSPGSADIMALHQGAAHGQEEAHSEELERTVREMLIDE